MTKHVYLTLYLTPSFSGSRCSHNRGEGALVSGSAGDLARCSIAEVHGAAVQRQSPTASGQDLFDLGGDDLLHLLAQQSVSPQLVEPGVNPGAAVDLTVLVQKVDDSRPVDVGGGKLGNIIPELADVLGCSGNGTARHDGDGGGSHNGIPP